jgi:hypothetical protein
MPSPLCCAESTDGKLLAACGEKLATGFAGLLHFFLDTILNVLERFIQILFL